MTQKFLAFALVAVASTGAFAFADDQPNDRPDAPRPPFAFFQDARAEDGKIILEKVLASDAPEPVKEFFKNGDKDGDGFLAPEEMKELRPNRGDRRRPQFGQPGPWGAPHFGFPGQNPQFQGGFPPFPPQEMKNDNKEAKEPEIKKHDFFNEDGAIVVDKLIEKATEAIKKADSNNDGVIDKDEQKAAKEFIMKHIAPLLTARMNFAQPFPQPFAQPFPTPFPQPAPHFGQPTPPFGFPGAPQFGKQGGPQGKPGQQFGKQGGRQGKPGQQFGRQGGRQGKPDQQFGKQGGRQGKPDQQFGKQSGWQGKPGPQFGKQGGRQGKPDQQFGKQGGWQGKPGPQFGKQGGRQGKPGPQFDKQGKKGDKKDVAKPKEEKKQEEQKQEDKKDA